MARRLDQAVFAGVASGGDGWVMRGAGGVASLRGKGAELLGGGRSLFLGAFGGKRPF